MNKKNKKGSVTVFLMIFFISIVGCIQIFISQSEKLAISGSAESLSSVFAQAILAEYDIPLRERYGIFGFFGPDREINRKCDFYAEEAFRGKKHIHYEGASCNISEYALCNAELFRNQIIEEGKKIKISGNSERNTDNDVTEPEGIIRNESILYYLPSKGMKRNFSIAALADRLMKEGSISKAVNDAGNRVFINNYIRKHFKSALPEDIREKTFFKNEQEYLVCGKFSDSLNADGIKKRIIGVRQVSNYACIKSDPGKSSAVLAAAELLTPGAAAAVTAEALHASWALAESVNDYRLLINGHRVPAVKTPDMWAVDLESVINNVETECIFTGKEKGENYNDYLRMFLSATDEELLLFRMMDLIQINMKYLYYRDFSMNECYGGVNISFTVNGENYEMEKIY